MSIQKVSYGTTKIQKLRRIALAEHLLGTLGIKEGDVVSVDLDIPTEAIVIRKAEAKRPKKNSRRSHGG